jgi:hypothetical protein
MQTHLGFMRKIPFLVLKNRQNWSKEGLIAVVMNNMCSDLLVIHSF